MPRSWERQFAAKVASAQKALSGVRRGHSVFIGSGAAEVARRRGLRGLRADILVGNYRALGTVNKADANVEAKLEDGYYRVTYRF